PRTGLGGQRRGEFVGVQNNFFVCSHCRGACLCPPNSLKTSPNIHCLFLTPPNPNPFFPQPQIFFLPKPRLTDTLRKRRFCAHLHSIFLGPGLPTLPQDRCCLRYVLSYLAAGLQPFAECILRVEIILGVLLHTLRHDQTILLPIPAP